MKRRVTSQSLSYRSTMAVLREGCDSPKDIGHRSVRDAVGRKRIYKFFNTFIK